MEELIRDNPPVILLLFGLVLLMASLVDFAARKSGAAVNVDRRIWPAALVGGLLVLAGMVWMLARHFAV